jgi:hypothetical protein
MVDDETVGGIEMVASVGIVDGIVSAETKIGVAGMSQAMTICRMMRRTGMKIEVGQDRSM